MRAAEYCGRAEARAGCAIVGAWTSVLATSSSSARGGERRRRGRRPAGLAGRRRGARSHLAATAGVPADDVELDHACAECGARHGSPTVRYPTTPSRAMVRRRRRRGRRGRRGGRHAPSGSGSRSPRPTSRRSSTRWRCIPRSAPGSRRWMPRRPLVRAALWARKAALLRALGHAGVIEPSRLAVTLPGEDDGVGRITSPVPEFGSRWDECACTTSRCRGESPPRSRCRDPDRAPAAGSAGSRVVGAQRHHPRVHGFRHAGARRDPREPDRFEVVGLAVGSNRAELEAQAAEFGVEHRRRHRGRAAGAERRRRRGAERHHRVGRTRSDDRDAQRGTTSRWRTRSRSSSAATSSPASRPARSSRSTPNTGDRPGAARAREEVRRLVLTASGGPFRGPKPRRARRRDAGRGARAPDLGHGPRGHHQLRDAREQGPRGDRGAPALRRRLRPHRRGRAPAVDRALDGRVRRRLDHRAGRRPTCACRSRSASTGRPVAAVGRPLDWTTAQQWTFEPLDDAAFPAVRLAKQVGRAGGEYPPCSTRRTSRRSRAFHAGRIGFADIVDTVAQSSTRTRRAPASSRSSRSPRPSARRDGRRTCASRGTDAQRRGRHPLTARDQRA